jgi:branched-chain amino acid transport system permease protein
MEDFFRLIIAGTMTGSIYGLVAMGFVLIYKASNILNFAQGAMMLLLTYFSWSFMAQLNLSPFLAIAATVIVAFILAILIERLLLRPLIGEALLSIIMATIGLAVFLEGLETIIWAGSFKTYPAPLIPEGAVHIGNINIGLGSIVSFLIVLMLVAGLFGFFKYTKIGLAMRAVAEDHETAQSKGIRINRIFAVTWIISGLISAFAGILLADIQGISYEIGAMGLKVFPVVLLGGLESLPGAIIAGVIIGILENLADVYISPLVGGGIKEICPYVILIVVLMVRPYGLFGLERIERI